MSIEWKCVLVDSAPNARKFVWDLAQSGIPSKVAPSTDPRRWHVAVPVEYADTPAIWLLTIRGADRPETCTGNPGLKHMMEA